MSEYRKTGTFEKPLATANGLAMLLLVIGLLALVAFCVHSRAVLPAAGALAAAAFIAAGFFMLQPNEAVVPTLFGDYLGTARKPGLRWTLPWNIRKKVSARVRNDNVETLKVNDKRGNPVEIAAVVVWCVEDTAPALFDVDDYENFVRVQSESALRHVATGYNDDEGEHEDSGEVTLRGGADTVAEALRAVIAARSKIVTGAPRWCPT